MNEMVERACRAIAVARGYNPDTQVMPGAAQTGPHGTTVVWTGGAPLWTTFIPDVRATIEAMREPTGRMIDAGVLTRQVDEYGAIDVWEHMLDAALGEPK